MLFIGLGVEPHETHLIHVRQKHWIVVFGDVFPIRVMLSMLAELMEKVTLFSMQTEIQADFVLELAFFWKSFDCGSSLLDMKEAHLEALVRKLLSRFFFPPDLCPSDICLLPASPEVATTS